MSIILSNVVLERTCSKGSKLDYNHHGSIYFSIDAWDTICEVGNEGDKASSMFSKRDRFFFFFFFLTIRSSILRFSQFSSRFRVFVSV